MEARKAAQHSSVNVGVNDGVNDGDAADDRDAAPPGAMATTAVGSARLGSGIASLTERRLIEAAAARAEHAALPAALPIDTRPLPSVAHYDELLRRRPAPQNDGTAAPGADGSTTGRVS